MKTSKNIPSTQSAVVINEFGKPDVLTFNHDVPTPELGENEVFVKIAYAGINPVDYKTRQGKGWGAEKIKKNKFAHNKVAILGFDTAGTVIASNSNKFNVGDKVATLSFDGGCYAEYNSIDAEKLAIIPEDVDLKIAGAIPCVGTTAFQMVDFAKIKPGEHVVMSAPAGGVGHIAVQLLMKKVKEENIKLSVICSKEKFERLKIIIDVEKLERWIDYTEYNENEAFPKLEADVLLDLVGDNAGVKALDLVKEGGRVVVLPSIWVEKVQEAGKHRDLDINGFKVEPNAEDLSILLNMIAKDEIKIEIQSTYPLSQTADAHRELQKGDTFGKIVLQANS